MRWLGAPLRYHRTAGEALGAPWLTPWTRFRSYTRASHTQARAPPSTLYDRKEHRYGNPHRRDPLLRPLRPPPPRSGHPEEHPRTFRPEDRRREAQDGRQRHLQDPRGERGDLQQARRVRSGRGPEGHRSPPLNGLLAALERSPR